MNKLDLIMELIRCFRLTKKQCQTLENRIKSYWQLHWIDNESPETEMKASRSWYVRAVDVAG